MEKVEAVDVFVESFDNCDCSEYIESFFIYKNIKYFTEVPVNSDNPLVIVAPSIASLPGLPYKSCFIVTCDFLSLLSSDQTSKWRQRYLLNIRKIIKNGDKEMALIKATLKT